MRRLDDGKAVVAHPVHPRLSVGDGAVVGVDALDDHLAEGEQEARQLLSGHLQGAHHAQRLAEQAELVEGQIAAPAASSREAAKGAEGAAHGTSSEISGGICNDDDEQERG